MLLFLNFSASIIFGLTAATVCGNDLSNPFLWILLGCYLLRGLTTAIEAKTA